jgi:hypothetical protein
METELQLSQASDSANGNEGRTHQKVTFSLEQQARVDEIVRGAMGRAASELREKAERLQQDLEAAQQAVADIHEQNKTKDKELSAFRTNAVDNQRDIAIQTAAAKEGFVDLKVVRQLTKDFVKIDAANQVVVLDDKGHARLNDRNEPMSLEDFYREYAASHQYLVKSDVKGGSGSSTATQYGSRDTIRLEQVFGRGSSAELANKLAQSDPIRYRTLKAQAKQAGLI